MSLLNREPDVEGLCHYLGLMENKGYSKRQIVRFIKGSEEYRMLHSKSEIPKLELENSRLNDQEIREKKSHLRSKPPIFNIDLIGKCNMKPPCAMCLNWDGEIGPRHHTGLKINDIERYGDFIRLSHNVINCGIGEPLLTKDLIPILNLFSSWEKQFGINSNGIALSRELTDKLIPYFEYLTINFSIDAATEKTYSRIRGKYFNQVIDSISYYCQKRLELFPDGLVSRVGMVMIPMRANFDEIEEFIRLAAKIGVDTVELRALNEIDYDVKVKKGDYLFNYRDQILTLEELEEARKTAENAAREFGVILDCQYQVSEEKTYDFFLPESFRDLGIKCILPWRYLLPYQNGDTVGCCFMTESLGNWREKGLDSLWNSPRMQKMRKEMSTGILASECWKYSSCPVVKAEKLKQKDLDLQMDKNEIIARIENIKKEISLDNCKIIRDKISERTYQVFKPNRLLFLGNLIQKIRRRLVAEIEHALEPILNNQKEINLRLLKEIEALKKAVQSDPPESNVNSIEKTPPSSQTDK